MSKENGIQKLERFFPKDGEVFQENGVSGKRKIVRGIKRLGVFTGEYTVSKIDLESQDASMERHEIHLRRASDGLIRSAVLLNGRVVAVEGFGEELSEGGMQMYAGTLFHNFAQSEEFIPPLVDRQ